MVTMENNNMPVQYDSQAGLTAGFKDGNAFALSQRIAKSLSSSSLVPDAYKGEKGLANCMIALELANRIGMSPFMVMQNLYVIQGRPSWSSTFLIAAINSCGRFEPLRFKTVGKEGQDDYGMIAFTKDKNGNELESPTVTIKMAKDEGWYGKNGSKWKTMPEVMLRYRAASFFSRQYCPEITMGMKTVEEIQDVEYTDITNEPKEPVKTIENVADLKNKLKSEVAPQDNSLTTEEKGLFPGVE
jgi:hypothetical protein